MKPFGPIKTLSEYVSATQSIIADSGLRQTTGSLWWRGQADVSWSLIPSLYRSKINSEHERELTRDFRLKSLPFLTGPRPQTDVEWMFLMQHHGTPTRVLDWSESPLVALFFAIENYEHQANAVVWALNPWSLNGLIDEDMSVPTVNSEKVKPYIIDFLDKSIPRTPVAELPIATRIEYGFNRAHSQRGMATIHGRVAKGIESIRRMPGGRKISASKMDKMLIRIDIQQDHKFAVLKSLHEYGIGWEALFPDLDGLSKSLNFRYSHMYLAEKMRH